MEMTMLKTNGFTELNEIEMERTEGGNPLKWLADQFAGVNKAEDRANNATKEFVKKIDLLVMGGVNVPLSSVELAEKYR